MITESLDIEKILEEDYNFIERKQWSYTSAFHYLYRKSDEEKNKHLIDHIKKTFHLNDIEYRSALSESNQLRSAFLTQLKEKEERIADIEIDISEILEEKNKEEKNYN